MDQKMVHHRVRIRAVLPPSLASLDAPLEHPNHHISHNRRSPLDPSLRALRGVPFNDEDRVVHLQTA